MKKQTKKRVLITGSSGMIGTALYIELKKRGFDVVGVDKKPSNTCDVNLDLRRGASVDVLLGMGLKFSHIFHLAANARVFNLVKQPDLALDNIIISHNVYEFARKAKIPRVILASSRETYGNGNELPVGENIASQRKTDSVYTASKIAAEAYAYAYANCYGISTAIVRYSNVYGRYDFSDRFIPKAIKAFRENRPFEIYGKDKTLGFTYLDDCISGTLVVFDKWFDEPVSEFNVSNSTQDSLYDVAVELRSLMKSESLISIKDNLIGEVMNYQADISKLRSLGWKPKFSIFHGLKLSLAWYSSAVF